MANPVRDIRNYIQEHYPGASVVERRRLGIKHVHPTEPNRYIEVASITPLHINGTETEIDTAWIDADPVVDAPWQKKMVLSDYHAYFGNGNLNFNSGMPFRYENPITGDWVQWEPSPNVQWTNDLNQLSNIGLSKQAIPATITDDLLEFVGAYGAGINYQVRLGTGKLEKRLVLTSAPASPPQFIIDGGNPVLMFSVLFQRSPGLTVWVDGVEWNEGNGQSNAAQTIDYVELRNASNEVVMYFDAAWAKDYRLTENSNTNVVTRFRRAGGTYFIEFRVPWSWLQNAVYPVIIDPTVNPQITADDQSVTQNTGTTVASGTNRRFQAATPWYASRWSVAVSNGSTVNSCYVQLWGDHPTLTSFDAKAWDFHDADNSGAFSLGDTSDITNRWASATGNTVATQFTLSESAFTNTASNTAAAEAVFGRAGWASGQYMVAIFQWDDVDATGQAQISSYEDSTSEAPRLYVDYTEAPSGVTVNASTGSLTLTGQQATIEAPVTISGNAGSLTLSGQQATIDEGISPTTINANVGSLSLSGQTALIKIISGIIVDIDHETGDLSQYTAYNDDLGDLSVTTNAALAATTYGLQMVIDDATLIYGTKDFDRGVTSGVIRWRFYIDTRSLTMGDTDTFAIFQVLRTGAVISNVELHYETASGFMVRINGYDDGSSEINGTYYAFSNYIHYFEFQITRATSAVSNDGSISAWIDGVLQGTRSDIDNYNLWESLPNKIGMGALATIDYPTTNGTLYLDELIVNDSGDEIGPLPVTYAKIGTLTLAGQQATIDAGAEPITINANLGSLTLTGQSATITAHIKVDGNTGNLTLSGQQSSIDAPITIDSNLGTLTLAGQSATINSNIKLTTNLGTLTLTGQTASLSANIIVSGNLGSLALTGQLATIISNIKLTANLGSLTLTGQSATVDAPVTINANLGSLTLTGQTSTIISNIKLNANLGTLTLTGQQASLVPVTNIPANLGSLTLTGQSATISAPITIDTNLGSLTLTGQSATINAAQTIEANIGSLTLTGQSSNIKTDETVLASIGSLTLTGQTASITAHILVNANLGSLTLTGQSASIIIPITINASLGSLTLTGIKATLGANVLINANLGSLTLTGQLANIDAPVTVSGNLGTLTLAGQSASIDAPVTINANLGSLTLSGQSANIDAPIDITVNIGSLTLAGQTSSIDAPITISTNAGLLTLTGQTGSVDAPVTIDGNIGALTLTGQTASIIALGWTAVLANLGSLTLTGQLADLIVPILLTANLGTLTLTGLQASIDAPVTISGNVGSLTLTGQSATITAGVLIPANLGSLTLAGQSASIIAPITLDINVGNLTLTGQLADIVPVSIISTNLGSLTLSGLQSTISTSISWWLPADLNINTGSIVSGVLSDTWSDNGIKLELGETTGIPASDYDFYFYGVPTNANRIYLNGYYQGNISHNYKIQQYNFNTTSWENLTANTTDFPSTTSDQDYKFTINNGVNYNDAGEIRIKILHTSPGNITHRFYIDYFHIGTEVSASSGSLTLTPLSSSIYAPVVIRCIAGSLTLTGNLSKIITPKFIYVLAGLLALSGNGANIVRGRLDVPIETRTMAINAVDRSMAINARESILAVLEEKSLTG